MEDGYVAKAHRGDSLEGPVDRHHVLVRARFVPQAHLVNPTIVLLAEIGDKVPNAGEYVHKVEHSAQDLSQTSQGWVDLKHLNCLSYNARVLKDPEHFDHTKQAH